MVPHVGICLFQALASDALWRHGDFLKDRGGLSQPLEFLFHFVVYLTQVVATMQSLGGIADQYCIGRLSFGIFNSDHIVICLHDSLWLRFSLALIDDV